MNKQILFYMHAGSMNHGCEAIAVSTLKLIEKAGVTLKPSPVIATNRESEDNAYGLGELALEGKCHLVEERHISQHKVAHILYYIYRKLTGDAESFYRYRYQDVFRKITDNGERIAVSIGGDNYCYPEMVKDLVLSHNVFKKLGMKTVLMGCSVEPDTVPGLRVDLEAYDMIIARESITYDGLIKGGISKEKIRLCPDPAFVLPVTERELPKMFEERKVIGINVSPMVRGKETGEGITMENCRRLIRHILDTTDYGIALVPHVVWKTNDDRQVLKELYDTIVSEDKECEKRMVIVEDDSASKLKYLIGKCHIFVGARTHATIAAYSQCVPTLVIGYSVKSRGIAKDLFGTDENYVIPVQSLKDADDLTKGFIWIEEHSEKMRNILTEKMPQYKEKAFGNVDFVKAVGQS